MKVRSFFPSSFKNHVCWYSLVISLRIYLICAPWATKVSLMDEIYIFLLLLLFIGLWITTFVYDKSMVVPHDILSTQKHIFHSVRNLFQLCFCRRNCVYVWTRIIAFEKEHKQYRWSRKILFVVLKLKAHRHRKRNHIIFFCVANLATADHKCCKFGNRRP